MTEILLSAFLPTGSTYCVGHNWSMQNDALLEGQPEPALLRTQFLRLLAALRFGQVLIWPVGLLFGLGLGVQHMPLALAGYLVQALWSVVWVTMTLSRRGVPSWSVWFDLGISAAAAVVAGLSCYPQDALSWSNFAIPPALGCVVTVALLFPLRKLPIAFAVLILGIAVGSSVGMLQNTQVVLSFFSTALLLVVVGVVAGVTGQRLQTQATSLAKLTQEMQAAVAWRESEERQNAERAKQYRTLHDTVLSTLSALARGTLDASDPDVQSRCAADAEYLRSIISSADRSAANQLQGELAAVGRTQAVLGVRVHQHVAELPTMLPEEVVFAVRDACREALNNVVKHSGESEAWITGVGGDRPGSVVVSVTDRGRGFDPIATPPGLGLRQSIAARMTEVGGVAVIDSSPGQGTSVELMWPK
ncbi:sensory histidine kinase UhpB [Arthrobacter ulcerisalmonis]|uniref:Sensory histidine kinase UhpB n=2 Tax=Arthrobacter ulcerisalmonis TaxID=2483813 RepID=A0A3P5X2H6_9MICC|nr:sensory histidine kinase UhpB [Arthrobacter ulcerisalmonis]